MELLIDTSTKYASIGLSKNGILQHSFEWYSMLNHSVETIPNIKKMMNDTDISNNCLTAIYVTKGPGAFSALRVGMSIAKSFHIGLQIPIIDICTLCLEAKSCIPQDVPICAIIPSNKNNIYFGYYPQNSAIEKICDSHIQTTLDSIITQIATNTLFCGEAMISMSKDIQKYINKNQILINTTPTRKPTVFAKMGYDKLISGQLSNPDTLEPTYLINNQLNNAKQLNKNNN